MEETLLVWEPCTGYTPFSRQSSGFRIPWAKTPVSKDREGRRSWLSNTRKRCVAIRRRADAKAGQRDLQQVGQAAHLATAAQAATPALPPCSGREKGTFSEGPASHFGKGRFVPASTSDKRAPLWGSEIRDGRCHQHASD